MFRCHTLQYGHILNTKIQQAILNTAQYLILDTYHVIYYILYYDISRPLLYSIMLLRQGAASSSWSHSTRRPCRLLPA